MLSTIRRDDLKSKMSQEMCICAGYSLWTKFNKNQVKVRNLVALVVLISDIL